MADGVRVMVGLLDREEEAARNSRPTSIYASRSMGCANWPFFACVLLRGAPIVGIYMVTMTPGRKGHRGSWADRGTRGETKGSSAPPKDFAKKGGRGGKWDGGGCHDRRITHEGKGWEEAAGSRPKDGAERRLAGGKRGGQGGQRRKKKNGGGAASGSGGGQGDAWPQTLI